MQSGATWWGLRGDPYGEVEVEFRYGMLVALDVRCTVYDRCYGGGYYPALAPAITKPMTGNPGSADAGELTRYEGAGMVAWDLQMVDKKTGDPQFHLQVVDAALARVVRAGVPGWRDEIFED